MSARRGAAPPGGGLEAAEETEGIGVRGGEPPLSPPDIARRVDQSRGELHRIVREHLGADPRLFALADEIAARGDRALRALGRNDDAAFERECDMLGDLETIVRTDGSRPSFLIRDGSVDQSTSPLGAWGGSLDANARELESAIACVGRIDNPANLTAGYEGTGFLVAPNLIITNRHVLQQIGWKGGDGTWTLSPGLAIDFGHEFRARDSVGPRKLHGVVFAGKQVIETNAPADHARLDLAVIELEPADAVPPTLFSVDASQDWAGPGAAEVYTIGYPFRPNLGAFTPTLLEQLFQSTFGHKRLAPGLTARSQRTTQEWTAAHDATTLGGNSGSVVVVSGRPVIAAGLHYGGSRVEPAENWTHILGLALDEEDGRGRTLRDVFHEFGVALSDRTVSPPAGDGVRDFEP